MRVYHTIVAGRLSLEFEWRQVSSRLQDPSEYSRRSQQCCGLDVFDFSSVIQFLPFLFQAFLVSSSSSYYYYCYFIHLRVFFTPALADGFPLECEWQQVFSSLQDSPQYSGRSQQCCSLEGLHSSSYFQLPQSLVTVPSAPITIGITVIFMFHSF